MSHRFHFALREPVRVPLRLKLTAPYFVLALLVSVTGLWMILHGDAAVGEAATSAQLRAGESRVPLAGENSAAGLAPSASDGALFIPVSALSSERTGSDVGVGDNYASSSVQSVVELGSAADVVRHLEGAETAYVAHAVLDDLGRVVGYVLLESDAESLANAQETSAGAAIGASMQAAHVKTMDLANVLPLDAVDGISGQTRVLLLVGLGFLSVVVIGTSMARRITKPLVQVVEASAQVAKGNLDVEVDSRGNDEVAVLAHSFNQMISGLREGNVYRDLLGRTVSPEVREQMRRAFAVGDLQLAGQEAIASVIIGDVRDFTRLSESVHPQRVLKWLNEYFGELVPIVTANGGVVNKFDGDAFLAFFGVLPQPQASAVSARQACLAAQEMLAAIAALNARRAVRGEPAFITGIGINTGPVTVGGLGAAGRLHYTIIGDTVNTTQRLEGLTRELGESAALMSKQTLDALGGACREMRLEPLGSRWLRGKSEAIPVYRLHPPCPGTVP